MESNKQLLKSLSQGKGASSGASSSSAIAKMTAKLKGIPGVGALQKTIKNTKPKQVIDITIFAAFIFLMYKFGREAAHQIDNQMPSEKSMMEMMRSMQGPPGMPPPPM